MRYTFVRFYDTDFCLSSFELFYLWIEWTRRTFVILKMRFVGLNNRPQTSSRTCFVRTQSRVTWDAVRVAIPWLLSLNYASQACICKRTLPWICLRDTFERCNVRNVFTSLGEHNLFISCVTSSSKLFVTPRRLKISESSNFFLNYYYAGCSVAERGKSSSSWKR